MTDTTGHAITEARQALAPIRADIDRLAADRDRLAAALARVRAECDSIARPGTTRDPESTLDVAIDACVRAAQLVTVHRVRAAIEEPTQ